VSLTLAEYSTAKKLPLDFLARVGVWEEADRRGPRIVFLYSDSSNGGERPALVRYRESIKPGEGFSWPKGSAGTLCLYGLTHLPNARRAGYVVLCEGESDCHTLWLHDFPALGVPGATNWNEERDAPLLDGIATIYVVDEGDSAAGKLLEKLRRSALRDRLRFVSLRPFKDPSALYLDDPAAFPARMRAAIEAATAPESEGRDPGAESDAIAKLAAGETAAFVMRAKADSGFVFEDAALKALIRFKQDHAADYQRLRAKLKAAGVRLAALESVMVAEAKAAALDGGDDGLPGRPIAFVEVEPWPEAVDGAALLDALATTIGEYVIMEPHQRDACALGAAFSHTHDFRDNAPIFFIVSPEPRCGKRRLLEAIERLAHKPKNAAAVTSAALHWLIETHHPCLLLDEWDALVSKSPELAEALRGLLNASFDRSGATHPKMVATPNEGWTGRDFSLWTPMWIAGIDKANVPTTVRERSVVIELKRKLRSETVKRLRSGPNAELEALKRRLVRWVADNEARLRAIIPTELAAASDRAADCWEPLLAIADVAGGGWPERARAAGLKLTGQEDAELVERDVKTLLLGDIRDVFARMFPEGHPAHREGAGRPDDGPRLLTKHLLAELHKLEERPWNTFGRAKKPMTDMGLASLLRSYRIHSKTVRGEDEAGNPERGKGYYLRSFVDAFTRYLPFPPFQPVTA
jgi:hypothetical protein